MVNSIDPGFAAGAYRANQNIARVSTGDESGDTTGEAGGMSFSDFLKDTAVEAVGTMRESESMAAKAVTGEADLTDVVQAVSNAEVTLQTVVAVRDRLVSAYQDIMSMPI